MAIERHFSAAHVHFCRRRRQLQLIVYTVTRNKSFTFSDILYIIYLNTLLSATVHVYMLTYSIY